MRKIFTALAVFLAVSSTCFAANPVNVCDFNADVFCKIYNRIVNLVVPKEASTIDESRITEHLLQNRKMIFIPLNSFDGARGNFIEIVTDEKDFISRISIVSRMKSTKSKDTTSDPAEEFAVAFAATLITVGLDKTEIDAIIGDFKSMDLNGSADKFCTSINRYVKIESNAMESSRTVSIEITAHD